MRSQNPLEIRKYQRLTLTPWCIGAMACIAQGSQSILPKYIQVMIGTSITIHIMTMITFLPRWSKAISSTSFYPDLIDKAKVPIYTFEADGKSTETCIIRFHAGPPYEDIAFRIANRDWEYSRKKGYKCNFVRGLLCLYFNFKRYRYWR